MDEHIDLMSASDKSAYNLQFPGCKFFSFGIGWVGGHVTSQTDILPRPLVFAVAVLRSNMSIVGADFC